MAWRKAVSGVAVRKSVKSHSCKGFMTVLENGFHAVKSHNIMGQRGYLKALNAVDFGYPGTPGIFFCHIFLQYLENLETYKMEYEKECDYIVGGSKTCSRATWYEHGESNTRNIFSIYSRWRRDHRC